MHKLKESYDHVVKRVTDLQERTDKLVIHSSTSLQSPSAPSAVSGHQPVNPVVTWMETSHSNDKLKEGTIISFIVYFTTLFLELNQYIQHFLLLISFNQYWKNKS